jgi:hypothetical protein
MSFFRASIDSWPRWLIFVLAASALVFGANRASASGLSTHAAAPSSHDSGHAATVDSSTSGLKLGEFQIRTYYPVESQKGFLRFTLFATVAGDRLAESRGLFANRQHHVRDQVIAATRLVPLADFDEANLTNFRRRIVLQLRRSLPELSIDNVYVSDFNLSVERL